jgi:hypothetical protein
MLRLAILSGLLAIATVTWGQEAVGPVGAVLTLEQAVVLAFRTIARCRTPPSRSAKRLIKRRQRGPNGCQPSMCTSWNPICSYP